MKKSLWQWAGVALMLTLLAACIGNKVYYRYDHTPLNGWEKNDTLTFSVPKMPTEGLYNSHLLLRVSQGYPFIEPCADRRANGIAVAPNAHRHAEMPSY